MLVRIGEEEFDFKREFHQPDWINCNTRLRVLRPF